MAFDFKTAGKDQLKAEYKRIANEIGDDQFFTKKELNYLPEVLSEGEQVLAFTSGLMDGNTWLIALTPWRIIFLDKGLVYGLRQTDIELKHVYAVTAETGMVFGKIKIQVGSKDQRIDQVPKKAAVNFANKVRDMLRERRTAPSESPVEAPAANGDVISRLERLAKLKQQGILTDEEFATQKARVLA